MAPNPALPYRDDCWSEGETSALVAAWGDRYVELNRGNLRQKHWQEVADAVNSRVGAARRPSRSDIQCKNRIDTLKKKYKAEKAKNNPAGSAWPFFNRLDNLIGSSATMNKPLAFSSSISRKPGEEKNSFLLPSFSRKPGPGNLAVGFLEGGREEENSVLLPTFSRNSGLGNLGVGFPGGSRPVEVKGEEKNSVLPSTFSRKPGNLSVGFEGIEREEEKSVMMPPPAVPMNFGRKAGIGNLPMEVKREEFKREEKELPLAVVGVDEMILRRAQAAAAAAEAEDDSEEEEHEEEEEVGEEGEGVRELARAIMGFAEVYERVEIAKQRQMMEMERQRMELVKEVEFQRMQVFVDSQVRMEKLKRAKRSKSDYR